ncbi:PREDICTED: methyltransferase-like protein 4 isoform X2 [Amphimedon queenslandica]|uniref:Methyltransferase-like protein 4 n=1 Tax=Amphimedon queenslandica TaxID=400682 RepID=A0AAN0K4L5_AMPQE|nr:PREDICTED: methyltransferase-like protein 4 isoform X2 [Amphimedon queenslandica]|eukprot:XP_019864262.1 PREDICTED: methyltransferase-like protein 4 isoform X2 [Amphimedon queenslandica]
MQELLMETIVWRSEIGAILKYPKQFEINLVEKRHGHGIIGDSSYDRKRKRKKNRRPLNKGEEEQLKHFLKIRGYLMSCYESLKMVGLGLEYFPVRNGKINEPANESKVVIDWAGLCELDKMVPLTDDKTPVNLELTKDDVGKEIDVFGKIIMNKATHEICANICGHNVSIPPSSSFLLSDISKIQLLKRFSRYADANGYNIIVLDPPWENRSAIRGGKYKWLDKEDISQLPIPELIAPGGLVALWVTNKRQLVQWTVQELLPKWGLEYIGEWLWIKVTTEGDFVFDVDSVHKKPYESLIIGKRPSLPADSDPTPPPAKAQRLTESHCIPPSNPLMLKDSASSVKSRSGDEILVDNVSVITGSCKPPSQYSLMCIPSTTHSQKPYLGDILQLYAESKDMKCLELFARNLLPGWTSWGNEVLQFQLLL